MTSNTSHLPPYLQVALNSDPGRPRLTYYDDATGERVELSAQTLANWVTKTMNLLVQDVDVEERTRVSLHLPLHWLTAVWIIAADAVGTPVSADDLGPSGEAPAGFDHQGAMYSSIYGSVHVTQSDHTDDPDAAFAVSLAPMAQPLGARCPAHLRDFLADVRTMPDQLVVAPERASLLADRVALRATELGLAAHDRVATLAPEGAASVEDLIQGVLAPLQADGSAVWTRHADLALCAARWQQEHVTSVFGPVPAEVQQQGHIRVLS
ncbi:MAG TPA: TIGR03089 family protein [Actinomycetes bacterium]|nr:TIGR03089 family protein [Actinomycetes bacterium]